jgi:uncharacterized membrane protein YeiB
VLLVNMELHRGPALYQDLAAVAEEGRSTADSVAVFLIDWLGQGKAYTVLAFLFGYGAHLIFVRAQAAGIAIGPLFGRRLAGLAALGVLHTVLLFWGDVLLPYAVSGTALLLAFRAGDVTLLIWAAGLVLALCLVLTSAAFVLPPISAEDQDAYLSRAADARSGYSSGIGATIEQHVRDAAYAFSGFVAAIPQTIALFFVGMVAARHRLVEDRERHAALWRRTALVGLGAGLPLNLLLAVVFHDGGPTSTVGFGFATLLFMLAPFVLAAGYLALGVLAPSASACSPRWGASASPPTCCSPPRSPSSSPRTGSSATAARAPRSASPDARRLRRRGRARPPLAAPPRPGPGRAPPAGADLPQPLLAEVARVRVVVVVGDVLVAALRYSASACGCFGPVSSRTRA